MATNATRLMHIEELFCISFAVYIGLAIIHRLKSCNGVYFSTLTQNGMTISSRRIYSFLIYSGLTLCLVTVYQQKLNFVRLLPPCRAFISSPAFQLEYRNEIDGAYRFGPARNCLSAKNGVGRYWSSVFGRKSTAWRCSSYVAAH